MNECVDWSAGLFALVFLIIPEMLIIYWVYIQNKKADREYERKLKEIEVRYK